MLENHVKEKDADRDRIASDVEKFLASGGQVYTAEKNETNFEAHRANGMRQYKDKQA